MNVAWLRRNDVTDSCNQLAGACRESGLKDNIRSPGRDFMNNKPIAKLDSLQSNQSRKTAINSISGQAVVAIGQKRCAERA